jgi:hypothetical protein
MTTLLKVCGAIQNNVFGAVLLSLRLLFRWIGTRVRADNHLSNLDCAALRAMTGPERESAVILFVVFPNFLNFVAQTAILFVFPRRCHWLLFHRFPRRCNWARVCWAFSLLTVPVS